MQCLDLVVKTADVLTIRLGSVLQVGAGPVHPNMGRPSRPSLLDVSSSLF